MPVNDIITQAEYNNIRNKVVGVLGTGSGNSGYGQPLNSSAVALGTRVTINEYANLRFDIINAWVHQAGSAPTTVTVAEGNTIRFSAVDAPVTTYDALANTLIANRFNVGAGQSAVAVPASSPRSRTYTGVGADFWNASISCTIDVQWPSANAARFFFNSGGQIRITSSRSGGSATTQNTQWTSILSSAGTQSFGGNNPGTGTSPMDGQNWYRLTNSFQTYYTLAGSSPYGSNSYNLQARVTDTANNSGGAAANSQFRVLLIDNYVDPGVAAGSTFFPGFVPPSPGGGGSGQQTATPADFPPDDKVDGIFTIAASLVFATGVLVPSGFGNFTVTQPTVTFGTIG
jgi:hypothetical protein